MSDQPQRGWGLPPKTYQALVIATASLPPLLIAIVALLSWGVLIHWYDLVALFVMYELTGLGLTMGFHRLFAHRSFVAVPWLRASLGVLGTMGMQGSPIPWVAHHRKHHQYADHDGDPHSPHTHGGTGLRATLGGLYHAHMGWVLNRGLTYQRERYVPDLSQEPLVRWLDNHAFGVTIAGFLAPAALAFLLSGGLPIALLTGILWGGVVRVFLSNHVTWSVNSIAHFAGRRRFQTKDESRNVAVLALLSGGEGWHNNHHAFPTSARFGLERAELDVTAFLIESMKRLGWVRDIVEVDEQRIKARLQADRRHFVDYRP